MKSKLATGTHFILIAFLVSSCTGLGGCPSRVDPSPTDKVPPEVLVSFTDDKGKNLAVISGKDAPIHLRYLLADIHSPNPFTVQFLFQDQVSGIKYTQPFISWQDNPGTSSTADTQETQLSGPPFPVSSAVIFNTELKEGYNTYTFGAMAIDGNGNKTTAPTVTVEVVHP